LLRSPGNPPTFSRTVLLTAIALAVGLSVLSAGSAQALVRFDFEQKYLVHPEIQTWDFCVIRDQGIYHIYYTAIPDELAHSTYADSLYHATSPDLKHWTLEGPVLEVGMGDYDEKALWAPDVVWDEATQVWQMAYTAADEIHVQRIAFATSTDLHNWTVAGENPVVEPEPDMGYIWAPDRSWSDFRDPYLYRENDQWHMLVTAKQTLDRNRGVIWHACWSRRSTIISGRGTTCFSASTTRTASPTSPPRTRAPGRWPKGSSSTTDSPPRSTSSIRATASSRA
jgi:hypothetical protein